VKEIGMWITLIFSGEKKCRKKNFFEWAFAFYFAILTAGKFQSAK
jgi:hypothetical protein